MASAWAIVAGLVGPAVFWFGYLYWRDRLQPEPLRPMLLAFALGVASGLLALGAYELLSLVASPEQVAIWSEERPLALLAYAVFAIGPIEELSKLSLFLIVCTRFRALDEEIDGMIYASAMGAGFATLENLVLYPEIGGVAWHARALASPLVHGIFASIWGWTISHARSTGGSVARAAAIGFVIAALGHGLYDALALHPALAPVSAAVIALAWLWRIRLMRRLTRR